MDYGCLITWFILKFAFIKTFTNAVTLGSNPSSGRLNLSSNPPSNPNGNNSDELLLLFPKSGLLLFPPKVLNPLNRFIPIMLKCEKYSPLIFLILVVLFYYLFSPWIAPVIILIGWLVKLYIFESVVTFWDWIIFFAIVIVFWSSIIILVV